MGIDLGATVFEKHPHTLKVSLRGCRVAMERGVSRSGQIGTHASGILILTPSGRIARYFYGIQYPSRDMRLGLEGSMAVARTRLRAGETIHSGWCGLCRAA